MPENEIERLTVTLEANYADFLKQIDKAVQEAAAKLKEVDETPKKAQTTWEKLESFMSGKLLKTVASIGAALAGAFAVQNVLNFFGALAKGAVDANAQFETFTVQFTTLLGSVEKAQGRIKELAEFGLSTPFELPEIVEADRLLQTFGGTALATGENLRRIGDSAAAVNASFKEVSFWTGRMFSSMMAGRPFGEASARLQELGIMSGEVRTKLEDMQKAGASGAEMWAAYSEMIDTKFAGAMDKLSKTFQGVMSNLADFQGMLLREGGAAFFEGIREDATEFFDIINDPMAREAITDLAKSFGSLANVVREAATAPILASLKEIDPRELEKLADSLEGMAVALGRLIGSDSKADIDGLIDAIVTLTDSFTILINDLATVKETLSAVGDVAGVVKDQFLNILFPLHNVIDGFGALSTLMEQITGKNFSDWTRQLTDDTLGIAESFDDLAFASDGSIGGIEEAGDVALETADKFKEAREAIDGMTAGFQDLQKETGEKLQELEADHGEKMTEIDAAYTEKQLEIAKDRDDSLLKLEEELGERKQKIADNYNQAILDLEEEVSDKRNEINAKANEALAKVSSDADASIEKLREDAREREKRETEEHQRDMAQLQERYLFDLQDAVKNRDARAIVDLRRRNQIEKREREQSFNIQQRQEGSDLDKRIKEIRDAERERRNEILKNQKAELSELDEHEAKRRDEIEESKRQEMSALKKYEDEKRADIEASYKEQMDKAEAAHQEQTDRENERYEERRQKLAEAMAKRLEDEAKALADQKDITEEGAKAILETLNNEFGIGGSIDKLMEDFRARRREKMTISIAFEKNISDEGGKEDLGTPNEKGLMGGPKKPKFQRGGFVPGPIGSPLDAIVHGGEFVIPADRVRELAQMRSGNAGGEMRVKLDITGSAPPGIRGGEVEAISATLVRALKEAGINARR